MTRITSPMPSDLGTVLWLSRHEFYVRGGSAWVDEDGTVWPHVTVLNEWTRGSLSTERPS